MNMEIRGQIQNTSDYVVPNYEEIFVGLNLKLNGLYGEVQSIAYLNMWPQIYIKIAERAILICSVRPDAVTVEKEGENSDVANQQNQAGRNTGREEMIKQYQRKELGLLKRLLMGRQLLQKNTDVARIPVNHIVLTDFWSGRDAKPFIVPLVSGKLNSTGVRFAKAYLKAMEITLAGALDYANNYDDVPNSRVASTNTFVTILDPGDKNSQLYAQLTTMSSALRSMNLEEKIEKIPMIEGNKDENSFNVEWLDQTNLENITDCSDEIMSDVTKARTSIKLALEKIYKNLSNKKRGQAEISQAEMSIYNFVNSLGKKSSNIDVILRFDNLPDFLKSFFKRAAKQKNYTFEGVSTFNLSNPKTIQDLHATIALDKMLKNLNKAYKIYIDEATKEKTPVVKQKRTRKAK